MNITPATIRDLGRAFGHHGPCGYAVVGGLFDGASLEAAAREGEVSLEHCPAEQDLHASFGKRRLSIFADMPERTREFIDALNAPPFLRVLSDITGIEHLHPDPALHGGGIHAIGHGGYLKLHTDSNWHRGLSMYRRLNLPVHLNAGWRADWNGNIELWSSHARRRMFSLPPTLGNAQLFESNDISYHGHPDPLASPEGVFRKSMALYCYTPTRPASDLRFGRSEMTHFVERPVERFEVDRLRRFRRRIQLRAKRLAHSLVPGRRS